MPGREPGGLEKLWADCDCRIDGDDAATHALRFSIYQLLIAANPDDPTVNIGAKSMTGRVPRTCVLGHRGVDAAVLHPHPAQDRCQLAALPASHAAGCPGAGGRNGVRRARYAWESADTGARGVPDRHQRRAAPVLDAGGADPRLRRCRVRDPHLCRGDRDDDFLIDYGAEILFETSRFWVDRAELDAGHRRATR